MITADQARTARRVSLSAAPSTVTARQVVDALDVAIQTASASREYVARISTVARYDVVQLAAQEAEENGFVATVLPNGTTAWIILVEW